MPSGSRGAVAFNADELRVLRRALALQPVPVSSVSHREGGMRELLRPTGTADETAPEGGRLRAFLIADLARHRSALPGAAVGYLVRLQDALAAGCVPAPDDLAALRRLCAAPVGGREAEGRRALLHRCEVLAERALCTRPAHQGQSAHAPVAAPVREDSAEPAPARLIALAGGRGIDASCGDKPAKPGTGPERKPPARPSTSEPGRGTPSRSEPDRHVPTPAEVFPPRRRTRPPATRPEERVAV